jgi:PPIC-type PPIASE domain
MINEELLVQRALVLDLPETTTEVRDEMVMAVNTQVAQPALAEPVSMQQLRAYYDTHKSLFTSGGSMNVTDLLLPVGGYQNADQSIAQAQTDANEAAYQLRAGADRRYIIDHFGFVNSGKADGSEQVDLAAKLNLGPMLYEIARTMLDGQISDPIPDADGVHLLIMDKRIPDQVADFDSVRSAVYSSYREGQSRSADEQNLAVLRRDAHILLAGGERE